MSGVGHTPGRARVKVTLVNPESGYESETLAHVTADEWVVIDAVLCGRGAAYVAAPDLLDALTSMMAFSGQMTPRQFVEALYSIDSPGLELCDREDLVSKLEAVVSQCWSAVARATEPTP